MTNDNAIEILENHRKCYANDFGWNTSVLSALDYVIALAKDNNVPTKWISVEEKLPEPGQRVLCYCRASIYEVMKMRTDGRWVANDMVLMNNFVLHWMPLPEPPKEET